MDNQEQTVNTETSKTNNNEYFATIKGHKLRLLVTLGFWKRCGFKREEASLIEKDINHYLNALKLAVYYGNKEKYGWKGLPDMNKMLTEDDFESCEVDYSSDISMATIWYLPKKLREITLANIRRVEKDYEKLIEDGIDEALAEGTKDPKPEVEEDGCDEKK